MFAFPWWGYLVIAGIIFSAYMLVRTAKEERDLENYYIEKEGEIFIKRMEEEKERRTGRTASN